MPQSCSSLPCKSPSKPAHVDAAARSMATEAVDPAWTSVSSAESEDSPQTGTPALPSCTADSTAVSPTISPGPSGLAPIVIELFSGTGGVTAALRSFGFDAVGIDKIHLKHALAAPMLLDVASPDGLQTLLTLIRSPRVVGIWAAPACGTCSAARNIPCRDAAGNLVPGPRPLRSESYPDGLPRLNAQDKTRVALANASYEALRQAIALAVQRGLVAVENPGNSLFWRTSFWVAVRDSFNFTSLHQCAFGGRRPKYTAIAHTHPAFCSLHRTCQCTEPHEPWGRNSSAPNGWATSLESAYPKPVVVAIAQCFVASCQAAVPAPGLDLHQLRAVAGTQPKASTFPPLVPEHASVCICGLCADTPLPCPVMSRLDNAWHIPSHVSCDRAVVPADAQFLRCTSHPDKQGSVEFVFGIPWSPSQFVMQAVAAGHPCTMQAAIPEVLRNAIEWNAKTSEHEASAFRNMWFQKWLRRALELRASEKQLKASLDGDVASILRSKRLCLWKEMLHEYGYPDVGVLDEIQNGTVLTGEVPSTGLFQSHGQTCVHFGRVLERECRRPFPEHGCQRAKSGDVLDREVKTQTQEEVDKGWLEGPFSPSDVPPEAVHPARQGRTQGTTSTTSA